MSKPCTVYFLRCGEDGPVKVGGTTRSVRHRINELQPTSPFKLNLIGVIPGFFSDEGKFKRLFKEHRLQGEWFTPAPEVMAFIAQYPVPADFDETDAQLLKPKVKTISKRQFAMMRRNKRVVELYSQEPFVDTAEIAATVGCSRSCVHRIIQNHIPAAKRRPRGRPLGSGKGPSTETMKLVASVEANGCAAAGREFGVSRQCAQQAHKLWSHLLNKSEAA